MRRRRVLAACAGSVLTAFGGMAPLLKAADHGLTTRPIPNGDERIPVIGIGSSRAFAATSE